MGYPQSRSVGLRPTGEGRPACPGDRRCIPTPCAARMQPQETARARHRLMPARTADDARAAADNVAKAAGDALVKAGAIHDDAQICEVIVSKRYAARGEGPAVHITLHAGSSVPHSF